MIVFANHCCLIHFLPFLQFHLHIQTRDKRGAAGLSAKFCNAQIRPDLGHRSESGILETGRVEYQPIRWFSLGAGIFFGLGLHLTL